MKRKGAPEGLTPRQEKFAQGVLRGLSQSEAYRQAGYKTTSSLLTASASCNLAKKPNVSKYIQEARAKTRNFEIATREEQENFLTKLMRGELGPETDFRLKASQELAKRHGLYAAVKQEVSGAGGAPLVVSLTGTLEEVIELASVSDDKVSKQGNGR